MGGPSVPNLLPGLSPWRWCLAFVHSDMNRIRISVQGRAIFDWWRVHSYFLVSPPENSRSGEGSVPGSNSRAILVVKSIHSEKEIENDPHRIVSLIPA